MEWINVKDRLPEDDENYYDVVLVWCVYKACKELNIAYLNDSKVFISEESETELPVTHWMPILTPKPPTE